MSKREEAKRGSRYMLEFKLEAVRLVNAGQEGSVTARVLAIPKQTLSNWVRLAEKSELQGAGERPVSVQQMELARLRAGLARVRMECDVVRKETAQLHQGIDVKYAWIAKNKAAWPITVTCEVLGVSPSGYFEHQRRREVIDGLMFYNHRRLHPKVGHVSPMKFEESWHTGQPKNAAEPNGYGLRLTRVRPACPHEGTWPPSRRRDLVGVTAFSVREDFADRTAETPHDWSGICMVATYIAYPWLGHPRSVRAIASLIY